MSDMDAFKSTWSEDMPTSPDTPATPGDELNMFATTVRANDIIVKKVYNMFKVYVMLEFSSNTSFMVTYIVSICNLTSCIVPSIKNLLGLYS